MFKIKEHPWAFARIPLVDQNCTATHEVAVPLQREIKRRIKKRMSRTHERRQGLSLRSDKVLREYDALVSREYGFPQADQAIPVPYRSGNPRSFIATVFALAGRSPEVLESLKEERFDIVRLKASGFRAFHILPDTVDPARIHRLRRQQFAQGLAVEHDLPQNVEYLAT